MENNFTIANGKIVTPNDIIENGFITIVGNKIVAIGHMDEYDFDPNLEEDIIDAHQQYILPGIIDIHTDALEAEIIPRPGADMPINVAFRELEKR